MIKNKRDFMYHLAHYTRRAIVDFDKVANTICVWVPNEKTAEIVARSLYCRLPITVKFIVNKMTLWERFTVWGYQNKDGTKL